MHKIRPICQWLGTHSWQIVIYDELNGYVLQCTSCSFSKVVNTKL